MFIEAAALFIILILGPFFLLTIPVDELTLLQKNTFLVQQVENVLYIIRHVYVLKIIDAVLFLEIGLYFVRDTLNRVVAVVTEFRTETNNAKV